MSTMTTETTPMPAPNGVTPIALGPGEGEALWFLGTLGKMGEGIGGHDRRARRGDRATRAAGERIPPSRPPQRGRVVLRDRGRADRVGRRTRHHRPGRVVRVRPAGHPPHVHGQLRLEQARFLLVTEPAGFEQFMRAAAQPAERLEIPPAPTAPPDMAAMVALAAEHGMEILGPPGIPA